MSPFASINQTAIEEQRKRMNRRKELRFLLSFPVSNPGNGPRDSWPHPPRRGIINEVRFAPAVQCPSVPICVSKILAKSAIVASIVMPFAEMKRNVGNALRGSSDILCGFGILSSGISKTKKSRENAVSRLKNLTEVPTLGCRDPSDGRVCLLDGFLF